MWSFCKVVNEDNYICQSEYPVDYILKYGVANFAFISLQDFVLKTIMTLKKLFFGV